MISDSSILCARRDDSAAGADAHPASPSPGEVEPPPMVLSFDVEEHHRIEAAAGLEIEAELREHYGGRMRDVTLWLLERLAELGHQATFFVVGQIARTDPELVRAIHEAGHELACHGWDHRPIHLMDSAGFREDVRTAKDALEQVTGDSVVGYRAPTFSLARRTAWALDILAETGFLYDSSIYPVRHDRYGVPDAPRAPFLAQGFRHEILELPPATLRIPGWSIPIGGGGYFRLFPRPLLSWCLDRSRRGRSCGATMLYFHPWEFDPDQPRLPLERLDRFRTYVGIRHSRARLAGLLAGLTTTRAADLAWDLQGRRDRLVRFRLAR
jgi:polysaccharide deacetylase family protein (PEP-CTERM system associated)